MIQIEGMIPVTAAAKRLNRSTEQVRRYLREGKLKGQRVGNQWFVEESSLTVERETPRPLLSPEFVDEVLRLRREINERNRGEPFDVVEMLRQHREED